MARILLNGVAVNGDESLKIDQTLSYMLAICEENVNLNCSLAVTIENLYNSSKFSEIPKNEAKKRLLLAQEAYCVLNGLPLDLVPNINNQIFDTFINGARMDAKRANNLQNFITVLQQQSTLELSLLAVFYYTLKLEFQRMSSIQDQSEPEKRMIEKLMLALELIILPPKDEPKQRLFLFCESLFKSDMNTDPMSRALLQGEMGSIGLNWEVISKKYLPALNKIARMEQYISIKEFQKLEASWANDTRNTWLDKPSCYSLTLDNYAVYPIPTFYLMADIYQKACERYKDEKAAANAEWQTIQKETEQLILDAKKKAEEKKTQHRRTLVEIGVEQSLMAPSTSSAGVWKDKLATVNKGHILVLKNLLLENNSVTFKEFSDMVSALGGKVITFDGSKTRIYLSNIFFNMPHAIMNQATSSASFHPMHDKLKVAGGFDKPHHSSQPLHYVQRALAAKALERAGLTSDILPAILEENIKLGR